MGDRWDALADGMVRGAQESYVADLTRLTEDMLRRGVDNPDMFAVLARNAKAAAMGVWARWSGKVTRQAERAFTEALEEQDEELLAGIERAGVPQLHPDDGNWARNRIGEAARGMADILRRQNVALADSQADLWHEVTAQAVTRTLGGEGRDSVMQRAVSRLAAKGLETVDYRSGVRTSIDAAVRRHVVTQSNQCRNDLLDRRCGQYGIDLVMVSAHYGARPSHAVWQGGVYSRSGAKGEYRGLAEATGYGTVGGLCGANCRHTMTPYIEGVSRPQGTDFSRQQAVTGLTSGEYYEAVQRQRACERRIRAVKREIAMQADTGGDTAALRVTLGKQQAELRKLVADNHLTRDYSREKAYGVIGSGWTGAGLATTKVVGHARMAGLSGESGRWMSHAKPISRKEYVRIRDMAGGSGIRVASLNNAGVDASAVEMMVSKACEVVRLHPELAVVDGKQLTIDFGDLPVGDYGCIYDEDWSTVHISRTVLRNRLVLERNYAEDSSAGVFVNAGSPDAVVVHELAHVLCHVRGIDCKEVVRRAIDVGGGEALRVLGRDVSACASADGEMLEALAESFVAEYYGVGNGTTRSIVMEAFG